MAKKRRFTPDTLKKIEIFLDEYKKNPKQLVEPLCNQLHLGKSMLYDYLRDHKMSLAQIREAAPINSTAAKPIIKNEDKIMTNDALNINDIKEKIKKVDALREDGFNLKDALKKSKTELTASQYYYYNKTQRPKAKKRVDPLRPTIPHTIEYIKETPNSKEPKKKQELLMMLGSPEALLDFVKKLQGG